VVQAVSHWVASETRRRGPLGERLVEPQVVPPRHGDEVAEPHVRQLVQDRQARRSMIASVTLARKTYISLNVTAPAFSIAPMLYSGVKIWSYFVKGNV